MKPGSGGIKRSTISGTSSTKTKTSSQKDGEQLLKKEPFKEADVTKNSRQTSGKKIISSSGNTKDLSSGNVRKTTSGKNVKNTTQILKEKLQQKQTKSGKNVKNTTGTLMGNGKKNISSSGNTKDLSSGNTGTTSINNKKSIASTLKKKVNDKKSINSYIKPNSVSSGNVGKTTSTSIDGSKLDSATGVNQSTVMQNVNNSGTVSVNMYGTSYQGTVPSTNTVNTNVGTIQQYANIKVKIDSIMKELKNARDEIDRATALIKQNYNGNSREINNLLNSMQ